MGPRNCSIAVQRQAVIIAINGDINPDHAEFLKWNNPPSIFKTVHYHLRDIKVKTWKLVRSWSADSMEPCQTVWICKLAWLYTGSKG